MDKISETTTKSEPGEQPVTKGELMQMVTMLTLQIRDQRIELKWRILLAAVLTAAVVLFIVYRWPP
jgi:hypothetical protein